METIINPSQNLGKKKELHIESRAFLTYLNICGFRHSSLAGVPSTMM
jgi:hypothetical protein